MPDVQNQKGGVMRSVINLIENIILGLVFFVVLTPLSVIYRFVGQDPLQMKSNKKQKSYWIVRGNDDPVVKDFKSQFVSKRAK